MNQKDRIRAKAEAKLGRLKPHKGHARRLRARLGAVEAPAPVEPIVEEVKPKKRRASKKKDQ